MNQSISNQWRRPRATKPSQKRNRKMSAFKIHGGPKLPLPTPMVVMLISSANRGKPLCMSHLLLDTWWWLNFCFFVVFFQFNIFSCFGTSSHANIWSRMVVLMVSSTGLWSDRMKWCNIWIFWIGSWVGLEEIYSSDPASCINRKWEPGFNIGLARRGDSPLCPRELRHAVCFWRWWSLIFVGFEALRLRVAS